MFGFSTLEKFEQRVFSGPNRLKGQKRMNDLVRKCTTEKKMQNAELNWPAINFGHVS